MNQLFDKIISSTHEKEQIKFNKKNTEDKSQTFETKVYINENYIYNTNRNFTSLTKKGIFIYF